MEDQQGRDPEAYRRSGWWRDCLVVDDLHEHATARPGAVATVTYSSDGGWTDRLTFAEMADAVDSIATGLLELGVRRGDPVCFQVPNWWHFTAVHLACTRIGAVSTPLIPILRKREVQFALTLTRSRVFIVPQRFRGFDFAAMCADLVATIDTLEHVFAIGGPRDSGGSFERHFLGRSHDDASRAELKALSPKPDELATIQFTSGTTGVPKGVMHTHNSLHASTKVVPHALGLDSSDVVMMPSPLAHASGFLYGVLMPVSWGMKVVYQDVWDALAMLDQIVTEGGTWTIGSPPFVMDTMRACRELGHDAAPLRFFACAGAPIPRHLAEEAPRVTGARFVSMWGLTETGAVTITPVDRLDRTHDSDGRPSPVMQVRIVGDDGVALEHGRAGQLHTRGASQFIGYFENPESTRAAVDESGWLNTGDLAAIDDEGFVRLTGRAKDLVIRGGENIPVVEVEAALYRHPSVREVAIVGVADARLGERACAVVVPVDGQVPTLAELVTHLESLGFAKQYWPERLELASSLPRTAAGKVQKFLLQKQVDGSDG